MPVSGEAFELIH